MFLPTKLRNTHVQQTDEGDLEMGNFLRGVDWDKEMEEGTPDSMVEELHGIFNEGMKQCYKTKKSIKKTVSHHG